MGDDRSSTSYSAALAASLWLVQSRQRPRMPWEVGITGVALAGTPLLGSVAPALSVDPADFRAVGRRPRVRPAPVAAEGPARKALRAGLRPEDADAQLAREAHGLWAHFLVKSVGLQHCGFGRQLLDAGTTGIDDVTAATAILFAGKPSTTLTKRLSAMKLFVQGTAFDGTQPFPLAEPVVYKYLVAASAGPATRGLSFRGALGFMKGFFDLDGATPALASARCSGAMYKGLAKKAPTVRATPLTAEQVLKLEEVFATAPRREPDEETPTPVHSAEDMNLVGIALFCLHGRLRVGDALKVTDEPTLDVAKDGSICFLEVGALSHKTAGRASRLSLPMVGLGTGVFGAAWGAAWLQARADAGMNAKEIGCLSTATGANGRTTRRLKVAEFVSWLRAFLGDDTLQAKSLKPTLLSWAARHGIPRSHRRLLGYHVKPKDRTCTIYSRDEFSVPLRLLKTMYDDIASRKFLPDSTRSGTWATSSDIVVQPHFTDSDLDDAVPKVIATEIAPSSSSSSSSSTESSGGLAADPTGQLLVLNVKTGVYHLDSDDGLACGKAYPVTCDFVQETGDEAPRCRKCFA